MPGLQAHFSAQASSESWSVRQTVAQILGESSGVPEGFQILVKIREKTEAPEAEQLLGAALKPLGSMPGGKDFILTKVTGVSARVRAEALWALSDFVATDAEVRRAVLDRLGDEASDVRNSALSVLSGSVGSDAEVRRVVLDRLGDEDSDVRSSALSALSGAVGSDAEVRRVVLDRLGDEDSYVRSSALFALSGAVRGDTEVRRAVLDRLGDEDSDIRSSALSALSGAVEGDAEVRLAVLDRLGDEDSYVRSSALLALSAFVLNDEEARRAAWDRLSDIVEDVRAAAVSVLSGLLRADESLVGTFVNLLGDASFIVRASAVQSLLPLSTPHPEASGLKSWPGSLLIQGCSARDLEAREVQRAFASVLGPRLPEDPKLKEWVLGYLSDVRWSSRLGAVLSLLAWPGGPPPEITDQIFKALEDRRGLESYPARLTAASFLINRNEDGGASINLCFEALDYGTQPWEYLPKSAEIRKQAALVLGKLEPLEENQRVYDRLLRVFKEDEEPKVRDAAYNALVRLAGVWDRQAARA